VSWSSHVFGERVPFRGCVGPFRMCLGCPECLVLRTRFCKGEYGIKRGGVCRWVRVPMPCPGPGSHGGCPGASEPRASAASRATASDSERSEPSDSERSEPIDNERSEPSDSERSELSERE